MAKRIQYPLLTIVLILSFTLACRILPWSYEPPKLPRQSLLTGVTAEVFSGENVHVSITYERGQESKAELSCTYPDGKGGSARYIQELSKLEDQSDVDSFDFVLKTPGTYQVTCSLAGTEKSAGFTIPEPPPAPPPPPAPAPAGGAAPRAPGSVVPTSRAFMINGTGTWTKYYTDPAGVCSVPANQVILQVGEEDTAELEIYYPVITTYGPPCTISSEGVGFHLGKGTVNREDKTVTYTSCADGVYKARGRVSYDGGILRGEVTCFDTGAGLTSLVKITMP